MGRRKVVYKRLIIGLDLIHTNTLDAMSDALGLTYSEVISYLMDYYQLGKATPQP